MSLVYLVHDLADAAVARRVHMLRMAGETPVLLGFRRSADPVAEVDGVPTIDLGRTEDARLAARAGSVMMQALRLGRLKQHVAGAQVILARNLEMLVLAHLIRARFAPRARVVFECLDIHASLVGPGAKPRLMRAVEGWLLQRCAGLVVSSPAFVAAHFNHLGIALPPVRLVENKVLQDELPGPASDPETHGPPPHPPWRIGWFGVLRCKRSLALLADLVRESGGTVEVDIRGRPARNVLTDFDTVVAGTPGLVYHGAYDRSRDLPAIYGAVHFTWAMDFYEAGANSSWLLPNRLYEGGTQGTAAIAAEGVETGRWVQSHGAGVALAEPLEHTLPAFLQSLTPTLYRAFREAACCLSRAAIICADAEAMAFAAWLRTGV